MPIPEIECFQIVVVAFGTPQIGNLISLILGHDATLTGLRFARWTCKTPPLLIAKQFVVGSSAMLASNHHTDFVGTTATTQSPARNNPCFRILAKRRRGCIAWFFHRGAATSRRYLPFQRLNESASCDNSHLKNPGLHRRLPSPSTRELSHHFKSDRSCARCAWNCSVGFRV